MMNQEGGAGSVVPGEVLQLLEERSRIQGWLDRLTELRAETTPVVYDKVRTDYEERLQDVNGRLAEHRSDLESSVAHHRSRVDQLEEERDAAATRLEEAELRYRVGEYGEEEWGRHREEGEAKTRDLEERLGEEREALTQLERVLGELVTGRRPPPESRAADGEAGKREAADAEEGDGEAGAGEIEGSTGSRSPGATAEGGKAPAGSKGAPAEGVAAAAEEAPRPSAETRPGKAPEARAGERAHDRPAEEAGSRAVEDAESRAVEEAEPQGAEDYLDELEFLESLSLDETDRFDAVSAMLDEEAEGESEEGPRPEEGRSS